MLAAIASFQLAPVLGRRVRAAFLFAGGLGVSVAGLLLVTQATATSGPLVLMVGFVLVSFGGGPLVALGIATLGSIGVAVYHTRMADAIPAGISAQAAAAARDTLAGATAAAHALPDQLGAALLAVARDAFTGGLHAVAAVSAVLLAGIALLILTTLRHLPPIGQAQPDHREEVPAAR